MLWLDINLLFWIFIVIFVILNNFNSVVIVFVKFVDYWILISLLGRLIVYKFLFIFCLLIKLYKNIYIYIIVVCIWFIKIVFLKISKEMVLCFRLFCCIFVIVENFLNIFFFLFFWIFWCLFGWFYW